MARRTAVNVKIWITDHAPAGDTQGLTMIVQSAIYDPRVTIGVYIDVAWDEYVWLEEPEYESIGPDDKVVAWHEGYSIPGWAKSTHASTLNINPRPCVYSRRSMNRIQRSLSV